MPKSVPGAVILGSILIAASILLAFLFFTPRYQIVGEGWVYVRLDTRTGRVIACRVRSTDYTVSCGAVE